MFDVDGNDIRTWTRAEFSSTSTATHTLAWQLDSDTGQALGLAVDSAEAGAASKLWILILDDDTWGRCESAPTTWRLTAALTLSQNFTFTLATLVATLDAADFDSPVVLTANGTQYGIRDISVRGSEMLVHFNELESNEGHFFVGLLVFTLLGTGNLQTLTLSSDVRAMANRNHVTAHVKTTDETLWLTDDGRLHRYREIHATDQLPLPTTADNARYLGATDGEYEFKDFAGVTAFQATWQGKTGLTSSAFVEVMEILEVRHRY